MKTRTLIDVKITCDAPSYITRWHQPIEQQVRDIEGWVKEFHDFIRDHRSQDPVNLNIERVYQYQCSFCNSEWEEDENGPVCCTLAQGEWNKNRISTTTEEVTPCQDTDPDAPQGQRVDSWKDYCEGQNLGIDEVTP